MGDVYAAQWMHLDLPERARSIGRMNKASLERVHQIISHTKPSVRIDCLLASTCLVGHLTCLEGMGYVVALL